MVWRVSGLTQGTEPVNGVVPRGMNGPSCRGIPDPTQTGPGAGIMPSTSNIIANVTPTLSPPRFGMTTANTTGKTPKVQKRFRLPDIPEREPDEVTQYDQLFHRGLSNDLRVHLGNYERTLVGADHWIVPDADFDKRRARYPDLMVAFGVDPASYKASNGYIVSEQGKAPDFVLEVASESTGEIDVGAKRDYYAALGIGEYWRFDETGEHHETKLAGDLLVEGRYEPVEIEELPGGVLQGYSRALNLNLRWEEGWLVWHDPATGRPIATLEDERRDRIQAEVRADAAESRNRELEEELRRLRGG